MEIALILKVAGIGILISVLNMILEKVDRKDWATLTTLVGVVIVLGCFNFTKEEEILWK